MFGMLDYRAHKLYLIMFFVPNMGLALFATIGFPFIHYSIGISLADDRLVQILISLVALVVIELLWAMLIFGIISKFFQFIFSLIVDIIPADGRTEADAQLVVWNGKKTITAMAITTTNPSTWSQDLMQDFSKIDWFQSLFYSGNVLNRLNIISQHYQSAPAGSPFSPVEFEKILLEHDTPHAGKLEQLLCQPQVRATIVSYSLLVYLIIFQPF
jgi:hypothetical protein